eukprot:gnl/Trimastix_PCT/2951.p1 GENE.gnl/Trimastix_PCT/2951~~gnl/Trimastix_PCT/2951.p1  ORF type:complete len:780 (+),score=291.36 gnl/Trimastix_PCT/2951:43-2382(+)
MQAEPEPSEFNHRHKLKKEKGKPEKKRHREHKKKHKKRKKLREEEEDLEYTYDSSTDFHDFSTLKLKPDHTSRPIWVCPNGHVFLETFSPIYRHAYDFLIAIAEPISRPPLIHEYTLNSQSLMSAVSVGLATNDILNVLERLSKNRVDAQLKKNIKQWTQSHAKAKLVLQNSRHFIESGHPNIMHRLLEDPYIAQARVHAEDPPEIDPMAPPAGPHQGPNDMLAPVRVPENVPTWERAGDQQNIQLLKEIHREEDEGVTADEPARQVNSFVIDSGMVETVRKRCIEIGYPTMEEYDFRNDRANPDLQIDLKPTTTIRSYQEKSLSKMFGNGRARSGIIVLPCGAGKTLVGITAACTIKKSVLVLCTSAVAVEQWKSQFMLWSTAQSNQISLFTSEKKEKLMPSCVLITTYTMLTFAGQRAAHSARIMQELESREWGLVVLDEVHVVPAHVFRRVCSVVKAHCKLGLTATLVREDERIGDLNYLIGPKLYEANWLDLQEQGFIARVQCTEVWCPMTREFYREYLRAPPGRRKLLYITNPNKFQACEYLIRFHERRGDKIIVFSDNVFALEQYATMLRKPYIYGETKQKERMVLLEQFKTNPNKNCIFLSKVGDNSIDLPSANVIVQISSHYGSRRQEAQRLGRILRPKAQGTEGFNAFFYSLVSKDTQEMYYATKRQRFLVDQGYSFKVTGLTGMDVDAPLHLSTLAEQEALLRRILNTDEKLGANEDIRVADDISATQQTTSLSSITGGANRLYMEQKKKPRKHQHAHPLFKQRYKSVK